MMGKILIKNGKVWDGEKFSLCDVLVQDNKIAKISKGIQEQTEFSYDATGKIVSAGLVDIHVHMQGVGPKIFGINAEMSCIPFGVTAAVDACTAFYDKSFLDRALVKNLFFAATAFKNNQAYFSNADQMLAKYQEKIIGVKTCFDDSSGQVWNIEPLVEVVNFAKKHNLKVMVHSSGSPTSMKELLSVLRKGDILTHAYHGGKNNAMEDNFESLRKAQERGVVIDVGFAGNVHTDFQILQNAIVKGVKPTTISTDITRCSAYKRGGRYGMTMCMSMSRIFGMTEEEIFKAVTSSPAKAVGKEKEWGYLREGRRADISVFDWTDEKFSLMDKNGYIVESKKGYKNLLTIIDGEVVYRS